LVKGNAKRVLNKILEEKVKQHPSNYLWSHRRWKYTYDAALHANLVVA
jgi:KDO2-lipid IV(A) lauroyltransferase